MDEAVYREIERLPLLQTAELQQRYRELYGEESHTKHRQHLIRRIAWRLQVLAQGDFSERARQWALALANDADLRDRVPASWNAAEHAVQGRKRGLKDRRQPVIGTVLQRVYRDQSIEVKVRPNGFEYRGRHYRSLSAIAREVTGTRWNGLLFFGLTQRGKGRKHAAQ